MGKDFQTNPVPVLTDVPSKTFDLIPRFVKKFGAEHVMFAGKVNGEWDTYNGVRFAEVTNAVSVGLMRLGVTKGDRVAIVANNSPKWNIIDFAAQQIGAVVVPVYPTVSHNDFSYIFLHSEAKIIFVEGKTLYNKIEDIVSTITSIEHIFSLNPVDNLKLFDDLVEDGRKHLEEMTKALEDVEKSIKSEDVATMLYTSGTMGTPKGVMLTHDNLMKDVAVYCVHYPIDETHRCISYLPLSHIYERSVQYSHVCIGCMNYYVENVGTIMRDIAEVKPHHFSTVPRVIEKIYMTIMRKGEKLTGVKKKLFDWAFSLADQYDETNRNNSPMLKMQLALADQFVFKEIKKVLGGNLQLIISGGAAVQPRLVKIFSAMGIPIVEGYGLTETSPVICTNSLVAGKLKAGTVGIPVGHEIKTDAETGEILVKGPAVMKGYYKDAVKTREAIDEDGFFHTGDKGEFDEDGMLHITGRIKEIFKDSMGKYISPALIENKFSESPLLNGIMVVGENQKFAAALIVPNFERLRSWCRENNIEYVSDGEVIKKKEVIDLYRAEVDRYNKFFGDYERIKKFQLLDREWTIDKGEITPSLKLRRKTISEHYQNEIESLFAE